MTNLIQLADWYCETYHKGQFRKGSNEPYSTHPLAVAAILDKYGYSDVVTQCIARLHDVVEDTTVITGEIKDRFGYEIANGVYVLSKNTITNDTRIQIARIMPIEIVNSLSDEDLYKIRLGFARKKIKRVKIADVSCNTVDLVNLKPEGIRSKLFDSRDIYIPMGREIAPIMVGELEQNIANYFKKTGTSWENYN